MKQTTVEIGRAGEDLAQKYLSSLGYKILERNWRWRRCEIDLIALHEDQVVFVEVKTRGRDQGEQEAEISHGQRTRIINAAHAFLLSNRWIKFESRFDLVRVRKTNRSWSLDHLKGAFEVV